MTLTIENRDNTFTEYVATHFCDLFKILVLAFASKPVSVSNIGKTNS